jgi:hypothetical protein
MSGTSSLRNPGVCASVLPKYPRAREQPDERVQNRPAGGDRSVAFGKSLLEPAASAPVLGRLGERRIDEQVCVDEHQATPRCARRSLSSAASSAETSDTSRIGRPGSSGNGGVTADGAGRALRRRSRLTARRNDSPVRARSLSISATTSSSSVIVVRMMQSSWHHEHHGQAREGDAARGFLSRWRFFYGSPSRHEGEGLRALYRPARSTSSPTSTALFELAGSAGSPRICRCSGETLTAWR